MSLNADGTGIPCRLPRMKIWSGSRRKRGNIDRTAAAELRTAIEPMVLAGNAAAARTGAGEVKPACLPIELSAL